MKEKQPAQSECSGEEVEETMDSRLIRRLLDELLVGLESKDKCVRLRVCQMITLIVNCMDEIE